MLPLVVQYPLKSYVCTYMYIEDKGLRMLSCLHTYEVLYSVNIYSFKAIFRL